MPTPRAVDDYAEAVAARTQRAVGDRLVGVWLVGSLALDDFDPRRSDVDIQAISATPLARAEREELAAQLDHTALPCPVRGLEFVLYDAAGVRDPAGPAYGLNLNTGPGMTRHVGLDPGADPRFWFTVDVSIARQHGIALRGGAAHDAFPELPRGLVLAAVEEALDWYAGNDPSGSGVVLGACRTLAWLHDGRWRSKSAAAAWARPRLPEPGVVDRALALRDGAAGPPLSAQAVAGVLGVVRTALATAPR